MRFALVILATVLLSLGASWLMWRGTLMLTMPPPPVPPPTPLQRQFGQRARLSLEAALARRLPETFSCAGGFAKTIARLREASGLSIFVNWRSVERHGGVTEETPIEAAVGGMTMRDALAKLLASLPSREPLAAIADEGDALFIDVDAQLERTTATRVYDVRDLLPPPPAGTPVTPVRPGTPAPAPAPAAPAAAAMMAQIEQRIAPGTWRPQGVRDGPRRRGSISHLSGQLIVTQTPDAQYDLMRYLDAARVSRDRRIFVRRSASLTGGTVAAVVFVRLMYGAVKRREVRRAGLCRKCGYDLRASSERCPECGTVIPAPKAKLPPAPTTPVTTT